MGEIGDVVEAKVDPALVDGSGDPLRKLPASAHQVETREVPAGEDGGLPTQEELATLVRVPAPIPWKGKQICTLN